MKYANRTVSSHNAAAFLRFQCPCLPAAPHKAVLPQTYMTRVTQGVLRLYEGACKRGTKLERVFLIGEEEHTDSDGNTRVSTTMRTMDRTVLGGK